MVQRNRFRFLELDRVSFPGLGRGVVKACLLKQDRPFYMIKFDKEPTPHLCAETELESERTIFNPGFRRLAQFSRD